MKFPDDAPVGPEKKAALRERLLKLGVELAAVSEQAVRGSGPGGQKKNKTSSGVLLRYELRPVAGPDPELLIIRWTQERQHSLNRFLALRELADQIEMRISPETSARLAEIARLRKQKARQAARHGQRHGQRPDPAHGQTHDQTRGRPQDPSTATSAEDSDE